MSDQSSTELERPSLLQRIFGGNPTGVIIRLVLMSLLVGFLMSVFGLDVQQVVQGAVNLVRDALRDGAGVFRNLGGYVLTGAALVVPIWLVLRLSKGR